MGENKLLFRRKGGCNDIAYYGGKANQAWGGGGRKGVARIWGANRNASEGQDNWIETSLEREPLVRRGVGSSYKGEIAKYRGEEVKFSRFSAQSRVLKKKKEM